MSLVTITLNQHRANVKVIRAALHKQYPNAEITVESKRAFETRPEAFAESKTLATDAKLLAEELRSELRGWLLGLAPQQQSKRGEIEQAIFNLGLFIGLLESAEDIDIHFPSINGQGK